MFVQSASGLGPRFAAASELGIVGWSKGRTLAQFRAGRGISSGSMHRIDDAERRRRIGTRHYLAEPLATGDLASLADGMAGIHATDPASVFMELRARTRDLARADVERALYEDRTIVKVLG